MSRSGGPVAVLGSGGHAKVVVSALRAAGVEVAALYDDDESRWGSEAAGVTIRGPILAAAEDGHREAVLAIGDNRARHRFANEPALAGLEWRTVIHPAAWIDPSVRLGAGTVVFAGAVIQPDSELGEHVIVNTGASIDHDCRIGDCVHVAPGARLAGGISVDTGALLGIACSVTPGRHLGAWAVVGAGAAVVSDVGAGLTVVGVPAQPSGSSSA